MAMETFSKPMGDKTQPLATLSDKSASIRNALSALDLTAIERLCNLQQLEIGARLSRSAAHDFNNLVGAILGYSDLLLQQFKGDDGLCGKLESIRTAASRATQITRQLQIFNRSHPFQSRIISLNQHIQGLLETIHRLAGENIEVTTSYAESDTKIRIDPHHLDQIILNLVINAHDAMPDGGTLSLVVDSMDMDESDRVKAGLHAAGHFVTFSIKDTGTGLSSDVQQRLFEPFFTTKTTSESNGIGLFVVQQLLQRYHGSAQLCESVSGSTLFTLYLPHASAFVGETDPQKIKAPTPTTPPSKTTILLVEDEPSLRDVTREILLGSGYVVITANNGEEALQIFSQNHAKIDLLFTDVIMPKMNGMTLAERALKIRPNVKILIMSGYTQDAKFHQKLVGNGVNFIAKPYRLDHLTKRIKEVLRS